MLIVARFPVCRAKRLAASTFGPWTGCELVCRQVIRSDTGQPLLLLSSRQLRTFALPRWNSSSVMTPFSRRSASLLSSSACPFPAAASRT